MTRGDCIGWVGIPWNRGSGWDQGLADKGKQNYGGHKLGRQELTFHIAELLKKIKDMGLQKRVRL